MLNRIKALMIIGQTSSGKESLSIKLAEYFATDIISMDSMKIYKGMNIGTAKPPLEAQKRIRHHMIDIVHPNKNYNVSQYIHTAMPIAKEISDAHKLPLFSGGTALYAKALLSGLFESPPSDKAILQQIEADYEANKESLYEKLKAIDPLAASKIHCNDKLRVTRALEVFYTTGKPISSLQTQFASHSSPLHFHLIGLRWPRAVLHQRIAQRVHWMIEAGLEEEVKKITMEFAPLAYGASKAVGYQEFPSYFAGQITKEELIERIIINTRQLAKHQMTWMKKFPIHWIDIQPQTSQSEIVEQALQSIKNSFLTEYLP